MPAGVIGLRATGKLSRDDYRDVLEPGLNEAVASGEARVVFVIEGFEGLEAKAMVERASKDTGTATEAELTRCRQIMREWALRDARTTVDEQGRPLK